MVDTFQGVAVIVLALLPGALSTWGFERETGPWGIGLADRLLRFIGWSAAVQALAAPVTFLLWRRFVRDPEGSATSRLSRGELPLWTWAVVVGYVVLPFVAGAVVGRATRRQSDWVRPLVGDHPSPTAWEHVFGREFQGTIRIKLKSGTYVAGLFVVLESGEKSYAAAYPHAPLDLWLVQIVEVDADTGEFVPGPDGSLRCSSRACWSGTRRSKP